MIIYKKINQFEILEKTFEELLITKEVAEEFGYDLPDWIKIVEISDKEKYLRLTENLGKGEASSIILGFRNERMPSHYGWKRRATDNILSFIRSVGETQAFSRI